MKVYLVFCKYYEDWDWELLKVFDNIDKAQKYEKELDCFSSYIDSMEVE